MKIKKAQLFLRSWLRKYTSEGPTGHPPPRAPPNTHTLLRTSHQTDTPEPRDVFYNVANFKDVLISRHIKRIYFQTSAIQSVWLAALLPNPNTAGGERVV